MEQIITKDNYRDLVWDETIPQDDYFEFYETLDFDEQVEFVKFLIANYPKYDVEIVEHYFSILDEWSRDGDWKKLAEFADFARTNSPSFYQNAYNSISEDAILYAYFQDDFELMKLRFAEAVERPEDTIDGVLMHVFDCISTDQRVKAYCTEVAEKVRQPLETSDKLIGGAAFDYTSYLYCQYLENAFNQIQQGAIVNWDEFGAKVEQIDFKLVEEFKLLPNFSIDLDLDRFNKNETYRSEQLNKMLAPFIYFAYTQREIPVYWAFRAWFDWRKYLVDDEEAPNRKYWLAFTPKMLDRMGGSMLGFFGGNGANMIATSWVLPHLYDYFLQQEYLEESTYARLMEYYDFYRRAILKTKRQYLWKAKGLYNWQKPDFLTQERYDKEQALMLASINWTHDDATKAISTFVNNLPALPSYVEPPPPEPSPWEKMMASPKSTATAPKKKYTNRKPKKRKKKHKDNRKRGKRKKR